MSASARGSAVSSGQDNGVLAEVVEEITNRLQAGEAVDVEAYAARHPGVAEELRKLGPALQALAAWSGAGGRAVAEQRTIGGELGDYRLLREVGRGGMGVVYEAEQISLGRRVALKVLPFVATMDPKHLQRFHNEARAAASLEHAHIVPVYAVGCERGVHFYAMKFIDGRTLAEVIAGQRGAAAAPLATGGGEVGGQQGAKGANEVARYVCASGRDEGGQGTPVATKGATGPTVPRPAPPASLGGQSCSLPLVGTGKGSDTVPIAAAGTEPGPRDPAYYRRVAEWGIQAALALEHAHQLGIVHRDVKPANLMIDERGQLWVTDFGLARTAADTGLTMSGDVVGTLRYMSPEQALAKHGLVDHRTDVYSLGATLYELLTLRPAVEGKDRQEVLKTIAFEEPLPPRRLNRAVPPELETVVLKAMQKEPADRYATAKELGDDLRRFLEGRPVQARRPTVARRLERWLYRHRWGVTVAAAGLLMAVLAQSGAVLWAWREKENARREQARAEVNLDRAVDAVDRMLTQVADRRMANEPRMEKVRRAVLEEALGLCESLLADNPSQPRAQLRAGAAYRRAGQIRHLLGEAERAVTALGLAVETLTPLLDASPVAGRARLELAKTRRALGTAAGRAGRHGEARRHLQEGIDLLEAPEAGPLTSESRKALAETLNHLGMLHMGREENGPAAEAFSRAISLQRALAVEEPDDAKVRSDLGGYLNNLALVLGHRPTSTEAVKLLDEAVLHQREALRLRPDDLRAREYLRNHLENLAVSQGELGRSAEAVKALREVVPLGEEIARASPGVPAHRLALLGTYVNLGNFLGKDNPAEAEQWVRKGLAVGDALVREFPAVPAYRRDLALAYSNLLNLLDPMPGRGEDVAKAAERAVALFEGLKEEQLTPTARYQLASCYFALDSLRRLAGRGEESAAARRQAIRHLEKVVATQRDNGGAWQMLAAARQRDGAWKEALAAFAEVRRLGLTRAGDLFHAAASHWQLGDREQARRCFDEGEECLKKNAGGSIADRRAREEAAKLMGVPVKP